MAPPSTLLDLGLTLRPEHDAERRRHIARLAALLGFRYVWLPVSAGTATADTAALAQQARPARLGLIVTGGPEGGPAEVVRRVADLRATGLDVLLEIHAPAELREDLIGAAGGPSEWRQRVFVPWYDAAAAGLVVLAEDGPDLAAVRARVAEAVARRREDGRTDFPISVALTVSIGRTMSEAQARAMRDPALSGARDPRTAGLFGTLEHAQEQALRLASAGADAVRATLADEHDVADLLAQLRSVAVGPTPVLHGRHG